MRELLPRSPPILWGATSKAGRRGRLDRIEREGAATQAREGSGAARGGGEGVAVGWRWWWGVWECEEREQSEEGEA